MALKAITNALRVGLSRKSYGASPVRDGSGIWGSVRESFAGAWQQGVTVDPLGALTSFGAVFACVSRIATDIAKLELELKMEGENGISVDAPPTSPYWAVLQDPNPFQNRIQFLTYWLTCKLLHGNFYALKARDGRGIVTKLFPLDPRRVTPMVTPEGDVYYSLGGSDLARVPAGMIVPASEIIHDRGVTLWHPLVGVSPIIACGMSATQGSRIQKNSANFFENMSRPSGMLTGPGVIDDATAERLKREWEKNYSGQNIGRLAVLGDGLTYAPMTIAPEAAQLIDQLKWTVEDVARCFAMPLYKIGAGPVPTAGNVEALESQYYSGCLQINVESIELCLTEGLGLGSGLTAGYEVELCLEGLLRMDSATQIEMLAKGVGGAIMAPNEARAKRNLPPVPGGDAIYLQVQNYSLEALAKRDAQPDPFSVGKAPAAPAAPAPAEPAPSKEATDIAQKALDGISELASVVGRDLAAQRDAADAAAAALRADVLAALPDAIAKALPAPAADDIVAEGAAYLKAFTEVSETLARMEQSIVDANGKAAAALEYAMSAEPTDEPDESDVFAKALIARFIEAEAAYG